MKRLLVFCRTDWLHPGAGLVERYAYEVLSRIAGEGHYVAWMAHQPAPYRRGANRPRIEVVDGIQVARMGMRSFYHTMMRLFLASLARRGPIADRFDIILDFITHTPLDVHSYTEVPVVPVVFGLKKRMKPSPTPPGPIIVPWEANRRRLCEAGVPPKFIVRAPVGVDAQLCGLPAQPNLTQQLVAFDRYPRVLSRALRRLRGAPGAPPVVLHGARAVRIAPGMTHAEESTWPESCAAASAAYCGQGSEHEALTAQAVGLPVLVPDTSAGREYVRHGETGLLHKPGDDKDLADKLRALFADAALRERLGRCAREEARTRTWDKTAGLILGTLENL